jgi:hypothetical protein
LRITGHEWGLAAAEQIANTVVQMITDRIT